MSNDRRAPLLRILRFFFRLASPIFLFLSFSFVVDDQGRTWIMWRDATSLAVTLSSLSLLMAAGWATTAFLLRAKVEGHLRPLRSVREVVGQPYNIWGPMALGSRISLALAVFLMFGTVGPLVALMQPPGELLRPLQVLILVLGSGGISASIILFGNRRILLIGALLSCIALNHWSDDLTSLLIGPPPAAHFAPDGSLRLTPTQLGDIRDERILVSIGGLLLLTSGYVSFIFLLISEGRRRVRLQAEMSIARKIQQSLIPGASFHTPWCDVSGLTLPASEVGGDYYDVVELLGGSLAIFVADVTGHGVGAGILGAMTKSAFRSHIAHEPSPAKLLGLLNATVCEIVDRSTFVTVAYVLLERAERRVRVATAGHPAVLSLRADGAIDEFRSRSLALGMDRSALFTESAFAGTEAGMIVLYTDGILESTNPKGEQYGLERMKGLLAASRALSSDALCEKVMTDVRLFSRSRALSDDVTFVAARLRAAP
ncbi:MAG TPA: PP2C family protein-serine/threonine phosphatase [Bacteroidota bacterium]|nr:PP2C family protein-serine/threonine phosphatase [Bacteroidota bacterium]